MRIVAIIQARMGSTRLPGKVLQDLAGEPMLARVVNRTCRATTLQEVVIATTTSALDDAIVKLCKARDWSWFRGSEEDVLDRYYRAAKEYQADLIVRITSDCPLIDPEVIDQVVKAFLERQPEVDYASNTWPRRTFPRGLDTEVMSIDVLERAWREDSNPAWREHVTPYIYRNPDRFRIHNVLGQVDYSAMRWTVDATEDLTFVRQIYDYFDHDGFSWHEVLKALEEHPEWLEINRHIQQKVI
jgi:spore coat polysaccharide biosynthesis protein SpsF